MDAIYFTDYEKISDVLMFLSKDISLCFNVSLAYKKADGTRSHYHKEYVYSSKYINKGNVVSIKRNFNYYLSIDVRDDFNNSVMITPANMIALKMKMKIVYNWMSTLFKYVDDKLIISGTWKENILYLNRTSTLKFEPNVCIYEDGTYKEGVRIYINDESLFFDLDIDRFMELYYIVDTIDMYQNAIILLNYIAPKEYGNNLSYINGESNSNNYQRENNSFFSNKANNKK